MFTKFKKSNKIFQTCEDFYNEEDLNDTGRPKIINLTTIENFNARGEVANPRAPCVVTTIDPEYIKDTALQRRTRKFRMKTDILTLREITRKKFMIYATQQRYLEKQREAAYQEQMYEHIKELQEFAADALQKSESRAFAEMKQTQQKLENLEKSKISDDLKKEAAEHQRVLMEVQEIYVRFLFILKLIGYFDEIIAPEDIDDEAEECKLPQLTEIFDLQINERSPIRAKEISCISRYMNKIVRPYLEKRNHLNADIWIKGYERTRKKIFNYNRRFQHLALLNHLVDIVHGRSEKTFKRSIQKQNFLKDPKFLNKRISFLSKRSLEVLENVARRQREDLNQIKLNAMLPVILENIDIKLLQNNGNVSNQMLFENTTRRFTPKKGSNIKPSSLNSNTFYKNNYISSIENVEKLQWHLMCQLQDVEKVSPDQRTKIEKQVRKKSQILKEMSRRVLVKQNRLHNWIEHFKNHAAL